MNRTLNLRRGFTLVELLVVISIIAIIAGLVVPALLRGRGRAIKIQCTSGLKQIGTAALEYANKKYAFPYASGGSSEPRAHESLNKLVKSTAGKGLEPPIFICNASDQTPAEADEDGKYLLDEDSLSYAWALKKVKATGKSKNLGSDKYYDGYEEDISGHPDSIMLLKSDTSVIDVDLDGLDEDTGLPKGLGR